MRVRNAGVSLIDQARVQNLKYFSEREKQKQPALSAAMEQLMNTIAGLQPQQQVLPPTGPQQQETAPPPPADASTETERMDTGVQEGEMDQSDMQMGDGSGAHRSGRGVWDRWETPSRLSRQTQQQLLCFVELYSLSCSTDPLRVLLGHGQSSTPRLCRVQCRWLLSMPGFGPLLCDRWSALKRRG